MWQNDIDTLYCAIRTYYYDRNHSYIDSYFVPSVYKIDERKFIKTTSTILCDPERKMKENKFRVASTYMHHYSYLKEGYYTKVRCRMLSVSMQKVYEHLKNWKYGEKALVYQNDLKTGRLYLKLMDLENKSNSFVSQRKSLSL